jgi:hypothetical protein
MDQYIENFNALILGKEPPNLEYISSSIAQISLKYYKCQIAEVSLFVRESKGRKVIISPHFF